MQSKLNLEIYEDLPGFKAVVQEFLLRHEAENSLFLGLLDMLQTRPNSYGLILARVALNGITVSAAFHTGHSLILTRGDDASIKLVVSYLSRREPKLSGIVGPSASSDLFKDYWVKTQNCLIRSAVHQRIYSLLSVVPPKPVAGSMRLAEEADVPLVQEWLLMFHQEALPHEFYTREVALATAQRMVHEKRLFLWMVGGQPVSMTGLSRPTQNGISVNAVYTPAEERRRGYASAIVATVSQHGLDMGKKFTVLYTDMANPTSNSIYMKIGYEPVCDSRNYWFKYIQ